MRRLVRGSAFRQSEHAFVAEGRKVVAAALDAAAPVETVFVAAEGSADTNVRELADRALRAGARVFELGRGVMERVADTVTPQPVCAIVGSVDVPLDTIVAPGVPTVTSDQLVLVCLDVRDPGNLGALMRSAAASGARALVCAAGTVDPFNPKTVRSSAGAIFHVALIHVEDAATVLGRLEGAGFRLLATTAQGGDDYAMLDWSGRIALVLGNEANG
ncbi:MAG: RNA methyltransferase, partial [Actinomycetota bacterium]|nr:RNA methyltransferase [Actinomycetota bacterium]